MEYQSNNSSNSASTVSNGTPGSIAPASENPKQPQPKTAKEVIAANVQSLIEQLEAGHSDALTSYLNAMSRFRNYSFGNILEIARQRPDASRVAGFWKWKELGRSVKKEHSVAGIARF
jgi:N-terminal domain of anti-restriction factor ArdC